MTHLITRDTHLFIDMNSPIAKLTRRAGKFSVVLLLTAAVSFASVLPAHASRAGAEVVAAVLFNKLRSLNWNVRDSFSWGFLQRGESQVIRTTLHSGNHYKICAAGCEDAYDVDIAVYDENGNLIDSDHDTSRLAVADITPRWTGTFYLKVTMYDSTSNGAHFIVQYAYE